MCRSRTLDDTAVWQLVLLEMMTKSSWFESTVSSFYGIKQNHKDILLTISFVSIVPPNIAGEIGVQDISVLQNRQVTLECRSDAVPPPILSWLKEGAPLKVHTLRLYSDQAKKNPTLGP